MDDNIDLHALRQFMISEWKLQVANIVIPVLSGVTNTKPFKNQKTIETLRNGIKNVFSRKEKWTSNAKRFSFRQQTPPKYGLSRMASIQEFRN